MTWYSKYLSVFEKKFDLAPASVIEEVRQKLKKTECDHPIASVVVIAHNEETRLLSCLWSISDNICRYPIEVIGVNNNSSDRTADVFESVGVITFFEEKKSCGYARRCGLEHARGKYYICIDADTMYPPGYIQTMIDALEKPGVVAVSALWSFIPDHRHSWLGLKIYEFLRDAHIRLIYIKRPELGVRGMVLAYRAEYGRKVGYRVRIIRGEDGAMALGLKQYGKIKLITSSKARAVTCSGTLDVEGSLFNSFQVKAMKAIKGFNKYFTSRTEYKDQESNLIK